MKSTVDVSEKEGGLQMNYRFLAVLFAADAAILIVGGMLLRDTFSYAPIIGWAGGLLSLFAAIVFSVKRQKSR